MMGTKSKGKQMFFVAWYPEMVSEVESWSEARDPFFKGCLRQRSDIRSHPHN